MMRNSVGIHFVQRDLGLYELVLKNCPLEPLERQKVPFCVVGKFFI